MGSCRAGSSRSVTSTSNTSGSAKGGVTELAAPELALAGVPSRHRRHPLASFVLRRVAAGVVTLFVVSILLFAGTNVLPGDVASAVLGRDSTPAGLTAIRKELHLNRPAPERYWNWLSGFVQGNLGSSVASQAVSGQPTPISGLIGDRIKNTAVLALFTILLLVPLSIGFGVYAATRAGRSVDHAITTVPLPAISLPELVAGGGQHGLGIGLRLSRPQPVAGAGGAGARRALCAGRGAPDGARLQLALCAARPAGGAARPVAEVGVVPALAARDHFAGAGSAK